MSSQQFKEVIRLVGVDLNGHNLLCYELSKIKGIGPTLASVIPMITVIPENVRTGKLTDQ